MLTRSGKVHILKAITDLAEHGHQASRRRITEVTGLKMATVDDHITRLREDGVIRSLYAGVFELVDTTRDRQGTLKGQPVTWRALVTTYIAEVTPNTTDEQLRNNPLSIYVRDYSWSRIQ